MQYLSQLLELFIVVIALVAVPSESSTILNKCCPDNGLLTVGFDVCRTAEGPPPRQLPPIYAAEDDSLQVSESISFNLKENLTVCPDGHITKNALDFKLFRDGTISVPGFGRLEAGAFCIHRMDHATDSDFAALYCVPDPCQTGVTCVRKCCPNGMSVNQTGKNCELTTDVTFQVTFQNESGSVLSNPPSFFLRDAAVPNCHTGLMLHDPALGDTFYILPDGRMYVPHYDHPEDRVIHEYCIDNFVNENGHHTLHALACFPEQPADEQALVLSIYPYFMLFSSFFLVATFVVYAMISELQNIHGLTIMCYVASLAVMYIGLGTIQLTTHLSKESCIALAIIVHFAFLSTFTWLSVMSFDIWWTFSPSNAAKPEAVSFWMSTMVDGQKQGGVDAFPQTLDSVEESDSETNAGGSARGQQRKLRPEFLYYSIYGWGAPSVIVLVGQILDNLPNLPANIIRPEFGEAKCWFTGTGSFIAYLYGPIAVPILANIFFFVMTAVSLCLRTSSTSASRYQAKQKICTIFSVFVLMGVFWVTEIISYFVGGSLYFWVPTDLLNILTGVFVFFIFVCRPNVWKLLKLKWPALQRIDRWCPTCIKGETTADLPAVTDNPSSTEEAKESTSSI